MAVCTSIDQSVESAATATATPPSSYSERGFLGCGFGCVSSLRKGPPSPLHHPSYTYCTTAALTNSDEIGVIRGGRATSATTDEQAKLLKVRGDLLTAREVGGFIKPRPPYIGTHCLFRREQAEHIDRQISRVQ